MKPLNSLDSIIVITFTVFKALHIRAAAVSRGTERARGWGKNADWERRGTRTEKMCVNTDAEIAALLLWCVSSCLSWLVGSCCSAQCVIICMLSHMYINTHITCDDAYHILQETETVLFFFSQDKDKEVEATMMKELHDLPRWGPVNTGVVLTGLTDFPVPGKYW